MADNQTSENIELGSFLELTGKSLAEAQNSLLAGLNVSSNMVLNNADIEIKVTVGSEAGKVVVKPVSAEEIRLGPIDPGLLSTLHISYVSTLEEPIQQPKPAAAPSVKTSSKVVEEVLARKDVQRLATSKGNLQVKPVFVAEKNRWLVTVEDTQGKVVKELIVPD